MADAFSPDIARSLPGPAWLRDRRVAAAERFASAPWPSTDEEVWRYSRVAELDLEGFAPSAPSSGPSSLPAAAREVLDLAPRRAAAVVIVGGAVVHVEVDDALAERGFAVGGLDAVGDTAPHLLGATATEPTDVFALLNDAFVLDPVFVRVPPGLRVEAPVLVVHVDAMDGVATFPRLVVDVGADAAVDVLEVHRAGDARPSNLIVPLTELAVGPAGRLGIVTVQDLAPTTWHVGSQVSAVEAEGAFVAACAVFGGDYARHRTDCRLAGRGASGTLLAAYFGEGDQTLDFRTFQDHAAPDTTSDLLFKGAVGGRSRSVYTGLIRVRKNARGTNAFQTNRNLKLSDDAWAESVPNLEIENNDVRCSHASAVGPIDEEQRFYLESRGVPPAVAERLVVAGFFDEVLDRLPVPAAVPPLRGAIAGKLARLADQ